MNVRIDTTRGDDSALARNRLGSRSDKDVDPRLNVGVARFADTADPAVADADIGFDDAPMVEDHGIGDDRVDRTIGAARLPLPHSVAEDLAAAEFDLLAMDRAVTFDLDDQIRIRQPQPIPGRRPNIAA